MYEIHVESEEFREKRPVQQHRMVTQVGDGEREGGEGTGRGVGERDREQGEGMGNGREDGKKERGWGTGRGNGREGTGERDAVGLGVQQPWVWGWGCSEP